MQSDKIAKKLFKLLIVSIICTQSEKRFFYTANRVGVWSPTKKQGLHMPACLLLTPEVTRFRRHLTLTFDLARIRNLI